MFDNLTRRAEERSTGTVSSHQLRRARRRGSFRVCFRKGRDVKVEDGAVFVQERSSRGSPPPRPIGSK